MFVVVIEGGLFVVGRGLPFFIVLYCCIELSVVLFRVVYCICVIYTMVYNENYTLSHTLTAKAE